MFSDEQKKQLSAGLDASHVSKRKAFGSTYLSYIEGHSAIDSANRIFGYDGWSHEVKNLECSTEQTEKRCQAYVVATVRVTVGDMVREDVGFGNGSDKSSVHAAKELAYKEAVTDAMKRALRTFGNQFGNSLYEKSNPLHEGGTDSKGAKLEKNESEKLLTTLSTVVEAAKTKNELTNEMKNFAADAKMLTPEHYDLLKKQAQKKVEELK